VADLSQNIFAEIEPRIDQVAWRINQPTTVVMAIDADEATETICQFGNRIVIQFQNGLPDWGGVIDCPQVWRDDGTIEMHVYSPERLLNRRYTEREQIFDGNNAGTILQKLLEKANNEHPTGIVLGSIWQGGDDLQVENHYTKLQEVITQQLLNDEYTPYAYEIVTTVESGKIVFTINFYEKLGRDLSAEAIWFEGENFTVEEFSYRGPIINEFTAIGKGSTWDDDRPVATETDETSRARYGLCQESEIYSEILEQGTCETIAATRIDRHREPWIHLVGTEYDMDAAPYAGHHAGDIIRAILPNYGFNGTDVNVRILTREFDFGTHLCRVVAEEDR
jgi:hypothetical protein